MGNTYLRHVENGIRFYLKFENHLLTGGEKLVLILAIRLLEEKQVVSKQDVCLENHAGLSTTYSILYSLERKGYIQCQRSKQFFSKSFISLSVKGLLFKGRLKELLNK